MTTPPKRHRVVSHSARETFLHCPRKFAYQYEMRLEPKQEKSSLRMGKAFSLALEHRDPSRAAEGYFEGTPLGERIMDYQSTLEIAQVELLSELYLKRYPDDVAPGRAWTPEFEFRSKQLGHGFLDAIIEESNGQERACPVHGEVPGGRRDELLGVDGRNDPRLRNDVGRRTHEVGSHHVVGTSPRAGAKGDATGSPVPEQGVREPGSSGAGDAGGEPASGIGVGGHELTQDALPAGAPAVGGKPVGGPGAEVQGVPSPPRSCSCRRTIGVENKLLGAFFWNDAARLTLAIDNQVSAYMAALREMGRPLDRLLYRVTKKPTIKPDSRKKYPDGRKGEKLADYLTRLRERIEADPDATFEQHELYRTDAQLDAFLEGCDDINTHIRLSRRVGAWPLSTKACTMFGGCSFLPLCRGESGATDLYRVREPEVKPKLPRLGKVQKAVLLALGDAFTGGAYAEAVATQTAVPHAQITKVLKVLTDRGYVHDVNSDPDAEAYWMLTDGGRELTTLLARAASDPSG